MYNGTIEQQCISFIERDGESSSFHPRRSHSLHKPYKNISPRAGVLEIFCLTGLFRSVEMLDEAQQGFLAILRLRVPPYNLVLFYEYRERRVI